MKITFTQKCVIGALFICAIGSYKIVSSHWNEKPPLEEDIEGACFVVVAYCICKLVQMLEGILTKDSDKD